MNIKDDKKKLVWVAKILSKTILENGGESFRAESTCEHILFHGKAKSVDVLAISTGIIISVSFDGMQNETVMCRIKKRELSVDKINEVNNLSRMFCNDDISLDELYLFLKRKENKTSHIFFGNNIELCVYGGLAAAFFTLLFEGQYLDFIISFICGLLITLFYYYFEKIISKPFITSFLCGMLSVFITVLFSLYLTNLQTGLIVTGSIMPILPGIIITYAFRDSINGDYISGSAGLLEALLSAVSLAGGVGFIINIFLSLNVEIGRLNV